jgi:glycosyltransferase involved in cell wall biosynthesis
MFPSFLLRTLDDPKMNMNSDPRRLVIAVNSAIALGFVQGQLQYFHDKGFEVTVLCPERRKDEWEVAGLKDISIIGVPLERKIAPLRDLQSLWRLWRIIRALRPTVTNVGTPKAGLLAGFAAWLNRVPCRFYTLHGLRFETTKGLKRRILVYAERLACSFAHRVICVSHSVRERALAAGLTSAERMVVLGSGSCNGVDASRFEPTPELTRRLAELRNHLQIPEQAPVAIFVGRVTSDKGIPELTEAFSQISYQFPDLRLVLVGCFEDGDPLPADTRRYLETHSRVIFVGAVQDTAPYYAMADVVVLPSRREGLPQVVLEAQAAGKPVIGAAATGIVDIVANNETGVLVPVGDVPALAAAIARLITDKALATRLGLAGQEQVKRKFRQEQVWQGLHHAYLEVLQRKESLPVVSSSPGRKLTGWNKTSMNIFTKSCRRTGECARWTFRHIQGLTLFVSVISVLILISNRGFNATSDPTFPVWVMSGLVRVGQTEAAGTASSISLSSARGETVDTQVIVRAPVGGLTNVNLSASALTGPGGASIPASSVTLYREYYLSVTGTASYGGGSNPPLGSGTYPEPLIPFNDPETGSPLCATGAALKACNATISAGQNQPYWIDIAVPHGATNSPPGTYTGSVSITATQGTVTLPVTLTVWNFELPARPSDLSLWTLWPPAAGNTISTLAQALMRNKVMGWVDLARNAYSDMENFGLNRSGLDDYYRIDIKCDGSYSSIPSIGQINSAAADFPEGLELDFYVGDELNDCPSAYNALKSMGRNVHAANRRIKTIMTTEAPNPNLYDEGEGFSAIDHWVVLDSVQKWPALPFTDRGDLWSYTSCKTGFGNTPEWMVDYPPINERIQAGFLNWTQGATGILYYRSDGWTAGNAIGSWNNVDTTACGGGLGRPGDGIFLYPPGPIASTESAPGIRLKAIRDGIQDYEYAQILKNLGQVPLVNSVLVPIATSWTNWSHDPNALEGARLQLGQLLNQLSPP